MRVTFEVSEDLMWRIMLRAARRRQSIEGVVAQLLEAGLGAVECLSRRAPAPVRLRGGATLDAEGIEAAIGAERD